MAKTLVDAVLDASLDVIATATKLMVCSSQPTTYTEAITTYALGGVVVTAGDGNGDFTIADGTTGRKVTVTQQTGVTVDASGTATYVALVVTGTTTFLGTTSCTSQSVTAGNTMTINAFKCTIGDPT